VCPHVDYCQMFGVFNLAGTLAVWKINYCMSAYRTCERYKRSCDDLPVPVMLMPNGSYLKKAGES